MRIEPKKILLVHNNPEERGRLGIMLSRFGHEVRFSCGKGCPDQLSRDNDLVIVDDKLAGQSGFDFLKQISGEQCEKVIYLSSRLWLEEFKEKGGEFTLTGGAVSADDVAEFLQRLTTAKHFTAVELDFVQATSGKSSRLVDFSLKGKILYAGG